MLKYIQKYLTRSTPTKQEESYTEQTDTAKDNKQPSSEQDFINEEIQDTPFRLIGNPTQGYAAVMGNYKITDIFKTKKDVIKYLEQQHYNVIANMMVTMPMIMKDHADQLTQSAQHNKQ